MVEYQGTRYAGFQLQRGAPTIQGELEQALARFTGSEIRIRGASRTDSGAHAEGQVVDFLTNARRPLGRFGPALNYYLPEDIRVREAWRVCVDFNSRRSACSRTYQYKILNRDCPSALRRHTHLWIKEGLDTQLMDEAAGALLGTHDFRPLVPQHPPDRSAVRRVYRWEVKRQDDTVIIECEASGFLRQQIRKTNAILTEIGKKQLPAELMKQALEGGTRFTRTLPALPAHGLCLIKVKYPSLPETGLTGTKNETN